MHIIIIGLVTFFLMFTKCLKTLLVIPKGNGFYAFTLMIFKVIQGLLGQFFASRIPQYTRPTFKIDFFVVNRSTFAPGANFW